MWAFSLSFCPKILLSGIRFSWSSIFFFSLLYSIYYFRISIMDSRSSFFLLDYSFSYNSLYSYDARMFFSWSKSFCFSDRSPRSNLILAFSTADLFFALIASRSRFITTFAFLTKNGISLSICFWSFSFLLVSNYWMASWSALRLTPSSERSISS